MSSRTHGHEVVVAPPSESPTDCTKWSPFPMYFPYVYRKATGYLWISFFSSSNTDLPLLSLHVLSLQPGVHLQTVLQHTGSFPHCSEFTCSEAAGHWRWWCLVHTINLLLKVMCGGQAACRSKANKQARLGGKESLLYIRNWQLVCEGGGHLSKG